MQHFPYKKLNWTDTPTSAITKAEIVRNSVGGGIAFYSVSKNSGFPDHSHKGYEYITSRLSSMIPALSHRHKIAHESRRFRSRLLLIEVCGTA